MPPIMTSLPAKVALLLLICTQLCLQHANSQSVLNPADPVITYDSTKPPPTQPVWGQIGKWVRTVRMTWNTDNYKAYIYKGMAFRLHFPKTYNPAVNDGKKYPIMVFFHGHGEYGTIYDNEFHLLLGHEAFEQAINNGTFDGYVLSPQSTFFFGTADYTKIVEIIEYMISNNKVDPFQITANGLSQGGQASWELLANYPNYVSAALPMSWTQPSYTDPTFINKVKYSPVWVFQGGRDDNPTPAITYQVRDAMLAAGANFRITEYPEADHATWWLAWSDQDFYPFIKRAYSSNPWQVGGKTEFFPGTPINATLGLPPGYNAYEWRKDGVVISGATSNTLNVTTVGVYDARVQRNGLWSSWSPTPITIKFRTFLALPGRVEAENWASMGGTQKDYGVKTEWTQDGGGGYNVGYIDQGDWMEYNVNPSSPGTYTVNLRIATPNTGGQLQIKKSDGTVLATVNLPNTGQYQAWQTIPTTVSLSAGQQVIRVQSSAAPGWNINWLEFLQGGVPVNQSPTVNAGTDQTIVLPASSVTLTGTASDPDGSIASYSWSKVSGPAGGTITSAASASTTVTGLVQGIYTFRLTVTDNGGATASDDILVTVNTSTSTNQSPTANAGTAQTITLPASSVTLTGSGSDADGSIASYAWSKIAGGAEGTISNASIANPIVNGLTQGTYTFRLTATDNGGASASDDVVITVRTSSASSSSFKIEAENYTAMSGVQTEITKDTSGGLNVGWIEQGDWMDYSINPSSSGTYTINLRIANPNTGAQLQIKKSDGTVLSTVNLPNTWGWQEWQTTATTVTLAAGVQKIRIQSSAAPGWNINWLEFVQTGVTNQTPTANAGADQTITLPVSTVTLSGSGADVDGSIVSYTWSKVSGGTATITSSSSASTTVTGLAQGSYTFRLTVTDNGGATASDDVVVIVNAQPLPVFSLKIEAELYSSMLGVQTQATEDTAGGLNVYAIDNDDWMDYLVAVPYAGTYTVNFRIASVKGGTKFQLKKADGTVLATMNVPNTGGLQAWQTISTTVTLEEGQQTLRIFASKITGSFNINWWELNLVSQSTVAARSVVSVSEVLTARPASSVRVYPNPTSDQLLLQVNNVWRGPLKVQIVGVNGSVQKQFILNKTAETNEYNLAIGDLASGQYIILVQMKGWEETKKISRF